MATQNTEEEWQYEPIGFVSDKSTSAVICQTWSVTRADFPNAKINGPRIAKLPALERQRNDLLVELQQCRDLLAEMRDKHLASNAAVVRAYAQKRIEAADAAIAKAKEQS